MVILKQEKSETRATVTYSKDLKDKDIEIIFTYEDEEVVRTANVKMNIEYAKKFTRLLNETIFAKELDDIITKNI
jgi:hypothetical protein